MYLAPPSLLFMLAGPTGPIVKEGAEMDVVCAPKRLLIGLLALAFAAMIVQSAGAAPRAVPYSSHGIGVAKSQYSGVKAKKHPSSGRRRVVVISTQGGKWTLPGSCTLGFSDGYAWGFSCGGSSANSSTTGPLGTPAARTAGKWSLPSGCTLGFVDGYAWGYSC